jgi:DNA-binding NarL/FixJ family response regulator
MQRLPKLPKETMLMTPTSNTHRPRLIIADDDPLIQSLLDASLREHFELVGTAADTDEAIAVARSCQPDAALVDVEMPKGGGLRAVRGILEVAPDTAVVVLSVDESDASVREFMKAGASAYRRKGLSPHSLAQSLNDSINVRAAERRAAT